MWSLSIFIHLLFIPAILSPDGKHTEKVKFRDSQSFAYFLKNLKSITGLPGPSPPCISQFSCCPLIVHCRNRSLVSTNPKWSFHRSYSFPPIWRPLSSSSISWLLFPPPPLHNHYPTFQRNILLFSARAIIKLLHRKNCDFFSNFLETSNSLINLELVHLNLPTLSSPSTNPTS